MKTVTGSEVNDDIDENYNSDLDPDNADQSPVMAKLVQKISTMRSGAKNTSGYIYMLTDSEETDSDIRVKVGTSRCPEKRVQQAELFNPEIRLLEMAAVGQRVSAIAEMNTLLEGNLCNVQGNWYEGPRELFSTSLQTVVEKFPCKFMKKSSESSC